MLLRRATSPLWKLNQRQDLRDLRYARLYKKSNLDDSVTLETVNLALTADEILYS